MKTSKSRRVAANKLGGKSHEYTIEIVVPSASGNRRKDGGDNRDDFISDYLRRLFLAIDECIQDVGGESRSYSGV